jgi:hypothetical protein
MESHHLLCRSHLGVQQRTVLDSVLFLVYINDLSDYLTHSQLRLFADDSIIYMPIKSQHDCNKLQQDLDAAAKWESDWLRDRPFNLQGEGGGGMFFCFVQKFFFGQHES